MGIGIWGNHELWGIGTGCCGRFGSLGMVVMRSDTRGNAMGLCNGTGGGIWDVLFLSAYEEDGNDVGPASIL
jgi:hypothetical protein